MSPLCQTKNISHFTAETKVKVESKRGRLVIYDDVKDNLPKQIAVSPISTIPHKSKAFRLILELSFALRLIPHVHVPSINKNSDQKALGFPIDNIGNSLMRLIRDFYEAPECANIFRENGV